ncbi:MAG: zinc ribbon domain-containing protein [Desulfobacteraceae bacterium]|nr:zinc ribbon domain-containing protein [Desulfobacteraceae bacterium]MCF8095395.1 zinc ribbon domain-containing protein [Desulfobacteraceae bacterium]
MAETKKNIDERFSNFGVVSFTAQTKVNDFVDYLKDGKVMATQCGLCGTVFFPPRADCFRCMDSEMKWREVAGKGKLMCFSQLQFAPVGFENDLPYCIGVLDYAEFKVFGRIDSSIALEELSIGMEMTTEACRLENGQLSYIFKKA